MRVYEDFETYFLNEQPSEFLPEDQEFYLKVRNEINEYLKTNDKRKVLMLNEQIKKMEEKHTKMLKRFRDVVAASFVFYGVFGEQLDEYIFNILLTEIGVLSCVFVFKDIFSYKVKDLKHKKSSIIQNYVNQDLAKNPAILEIFKDIKMTEEEILEFLFLYSDFCESFTDSVPGKENLNNVRTRKNNNFDKR